MKELFVFLKFSLKIYFLEQVTHLIFMIQK